MKRIDVLYLSIGGLGGQKLELDPKIAKKLIFVKNSIFPFFPLQILFFTLFGPPLCGPGGGLVG